MYPFKYSLSDIDRWKMLPISSVANIIFQFSNGKRDLIVVRLAIGQSDKIHFLLTHHSDINVSIATGQFKIDDVFFGNADFCQFFAKKLKKIRFSSSTDTRNNLYDILIFPQIKPLEVIRFCDFFCYTHKNLSFEKVFYCMIAIYADCNL